MLLEAFWREVKIVVTHRASQVGKTIGIHTLPRQIVFSRMNYRLALCALLGGIAMLAVASQREVGMPQREVITVAAVLDTQPTYRYINRPSGVAQVQQSSDGGRTWAHGGLLPEPVLQLEPDPVDDAVVFARTEFNLWRSATGGASWTKVANLPGRPLSLALTARAAPAGLIFLGTDDHGLYTSADSGKTWQAAGGRLSLVGAGALAISSLMVNPEHEQVVYVAATFNMATPQGLHSMPFAFLSVDDGDRWIELMNPAPALEVRAPAPILAPNADPVAPAPGANGNTAADAWGMAAFAALLLLTVLAVVLLWPRPRPAAPVSPT